VSDSIWKKEIGFKRKPKDDEPGETAESLRVKELAFQRKLEEASQASAVVQEVVPPPVPDSIWKKEISFRRRSAEPEPVVEGTATPVESREAAAEPPVSIWKKEINFRKKGDATGSQHRGDSIWHKEISLRRREARNAHIRKLAEEALLQVGPEDDTDMEEEEPWLAQPELPPEPDVVPAPVVPKPKARRETPATDAPEPEEASEKASIWKREIGGKKKAATETPTNEAGSPEEPRTKKPKTRLRDVKIGRPKTARSSSSNHPVKRLVGLKIGASQLAAARVVNNGAAELVQVARQPLEQGVVVSGEVRDPEALAVALKQFFSRNKLPRKNVRLGIASNRIGVRIFDLVGIADDKQLENAIRFRAQETLPIPLDEAVLDYHVLSESVDEDGTSLQRILLVVAYRELVDRYVSACKKAGIALAGVDLEAFALLRALAAPRSEESETDSALVAVSIGHDRSTFAVSDGHICEFTRVIEWGGATLSVAIARALDLAPSEVEQMKRLVSLESPAVPDGVDPQQYGLTVEAVRRQVQAFARELVSSLQFYQHQPGSLGIGEIVITGGTAGLAGLAAELQSLIGVRVRVGDPLARLKVPKKLPVDEGLGSYAVAIGLGIED
jgi:type IV pilus assembly protein PilM